MQSCAEREEMALDNINTWALQNTILYIILK